MLEMLALLVTREKDDVDAGIFPLAFSDMPPICKGSASSADSAIDVALELRDEAGGVARVICSSSESSSSPIANAPPSSGTLLNDGALTLVGDLILSVEPLRCCVDRDSGISASCFRIAACRSSSL